MTARKYRITWSRTNVTGPDGDPVSCVETLRIFAGRLLRMARRGESVTVHRIVRDLGT